MARKKARRRLPQEPEEILTLAQRSLNLVKPYLRWLLVGGGVVLLVLLGWSTYSYLTYRREAQAQAALEQVRPGLSQPDKADEILKALDRLVEEHGGTNAARLGELYRAHLLFQTRKYEEATKAYEALQAALRGKDLMNLRPLVTESLSYCYEARGDYAKAAEILKPLAEETKGAYQTVLLSHLAQLYDQAGNHEAAAALWQRLLNKAPNPALASYWKERLTAAGQKKR